MSKPWPEKVLIAYRIEDAKWTVPDADETHACSRCGHRMILLPSSIERLRKEPLPLVCTQCMHWRIIELGKFPELQTAATWEQLQDEYRRAIPIKKRDD